MPRHQDAASSIKKAGNLRQNAEYPSLTPSTALARMIDIFMHEVRR